MVHGQPARAAHFVRLHLGTAAPHARRHPPSDLGHPARPRAGGARNAHPRHPGRFDRTHVGALRPRLFRHGRAAMNERGQMRTALGRVRGLGAAHTGTGHFWHQRVTSVAGIPLTIAFIVIVIALLGRSHATVVQVLGSPLVALLMLLFIINSAYHMWIGMQEIILDYVHEDLPKFVSLMANTFFVFAVALAAVYALLRLSFGV